ncbi:MAG: hypothetical protein ABI164_09660, partial [Acidobacteriaceae bacterium]
QAFRDWDARAGGGRDKAEQDAVGRGAVEQGEDEPITPGPNQPGQDGQNNPGESARNKLTAGTGSDRLKQLGRVWASALACPQELHATATGVFPAGAEKDRAGNLLLELVRAGIENDFEEVVFTQYPSLRDILEILKNDNQAESHAMYAALSGSGSALFGLYRTAADKSAAAKRLKERGIPGLETKIIGRAEYWRDMVVAS